MKRPLLLASLLLAVLAAGRAQCPNFTDLTGPGVTCMYGVYLSPMMNTGLVPGRHTVITQQGMDPYTGYQLPMLPPGESAVVKLGNDLGDSQGESIDYQFVVDPDHPILTIKYAVVLKNFGFMGSGCPMFSIYLLDNSGYGGLSIYPCGKYYFSTSLWMESNYQVSGSVTWLPWTTMSIDLSQYAGQQVKARFCTYDGYYNYEAFGYAYITATCMSDHLTVVDCDGQYVTLAAPEGFAHYQWSNGSTSSTSTYSLQEDLDIYCHVSSSPGIGCEHTYDYQSIESLNLTAGSTWYDTICQGDSYNAHGFQLLSQNETGTFTYTSVSLNASDCQSGALNTLHLTVQLRNIHYYDAVCEGEDYDQYGFHYTNLPAGSFTDSLPNEVPPECSPAYKYLHLTVIPSTSASFELFGDTFVCDGQLNTYIMNHAGPLTDYEWHIPEGVSNYSSSYGPLVDLYFTQDAPNPVVISVTGTNACGAYTLEKTVWHTPAYYFSYEDTVCSGNTYAGHGIQTPIIDSVGLFYLSQHYTTINGCDSDVMVRLMVYPSPEVTTLAQPEEICSEENTILLAVGEYGAIVPHSPQLVVPGDIVCTDSTIVKPADWPVPGKTAKAVVYFVDTTGEHGWAVNLHDQGSFPWGNTYLPESSGLSSTIMEPEFALDGKLNTQKLRLYGDAASFPAVWSVDFDHGWYLPAIGQLMLIFYELSTINETLSLVSGDPFTPSPTYEPMASWYYHYWSSTPQQFSQPGSNLPCNPWAFDVFNYMDSSGLPGVALRVRSIIDF